MDVRSTFTQDVADKICRRLADGETLTSICRDERMPTRRTVTTWRHRNEEFAVAYDEAVLAGCHVLLDQTLEIADDARNDFMVSQKGDATIDQENIQRSKLRIWARHELVKKKRPDVFSDKVAMQHSGAVTNVQMTHEQWLASLK